MVEDFFAGGGSIEVAEISLPQVEHIELALLLLDDCRLPAPSETSSVWNHVREVKGVSVWPLHPVIKQIYFCYCITLWNFDDVVGIENWQDKYDKVGTATICSLSIIFNNEWISKSDGAEDTNIEAIKGGISGAFKRACSRWGIGRYLYGLTESFAKFVPKGTKGARQCKIEGKYYHWLPPDLPKWALPESEAKKASNELLETIDKVIAAYDVIGIAKVTLESLVGHSLVELDEEEIKTLRAYYPEYKSGKRNIQDDISGKDRDVKTKEINKQEDLI